MIELDIISPAWLSTVLPGVAGLLLLTASVLHAQSANKKLQVPAKEIPIPSTISPELQQSVAAPLIRPPAPTKDSEWRKLQETRDAEWTEEARALVASLGVTVAETKLGGVRCYTILPNEVRPESENRLLLHLHGGAYAFGSGEAGISEAVLVAHFCRTRAVSVDYRMPPDHPCPAAIDDAVAVWRALIADYAHERLALFGTSAGGGLAMATILKLKDDHLPLPGATYLGTPWTDLSKTGDSYFTNAEIDNVVGRYEGLLAATAQLYANKLSLTSPPVSPIYGDLRGFPPTLLVSGTRDLFLSNTVRAHRKLRAAGVTADLHVYEGQSHAHHLASYPAPESCDALTEIARFFDYHLSPPKGGES